jgi:hypothetical protein
MSQFFSDTAVCSETLRFRPCFRLCSPGYVNLLQMQFRFNTCAADSPLRTQYLRPERGGSNRTVRKSELSARVVNCVMYTRESSWNPHSRTREHDHPQHDHPAACVIAQQYSSTAFVSLLFDSRRKNSARFSKKLYIYIFFKFRTTENS